MTACPTPQSPATTTSVTRSRPTRNLGKHVQDRTLIHCQPVIIGPEFTDDERLAIVEYLRFTAICLRLLPTMKLRNAGWAGNIVSDQMGAKHAPNTALTLRPSKRRGA